MDRNNPIICRVCVLSRALSRSAISSLRCVSRCLLTIKYSIICPHVMLTVCALQLRQVWPLYVERTNMNHVLYADQFLPSSLSTAVCCAWCCPCVVFSKTRQRMRSMQYHGRPLAGGGNKCSNHCLIYFATMFTGHSWCLQVRCDVD
jgi:hypothetical protein